MKKLITLLALVAVASAYSQGTINFNNRVSPGIVDAPISYAAGGPATAARINGAGTIAGTLDFGGRFARAGLYGGPTGTEEQNLVLLTPAVGFRTGAAAGYVDQSDTSRTLATVPPGGTGVFQVRAWDTGDLQASATFENAVALGATTHGAYYGASPLLSVGPLGGGSPALPAPNMVGLAAFTIGYHVVPEPSIIGLGILGGLAGLLVFRRRN